MSLIEVSHLWKTYPGQTVLEDINLSLDEGEFVTIVGASGCGKTTFLRILLGAEQPSKGTVTLSGQPLAGEPGPDRGIVFQRYSVIPHLTVVQNVLLGLELGSQRWIGRAFGRRRKRYLAAATDMLRRVGLSDRLHSYPDTLSGGMQQRLALAQTLVCEPRILLLDEPFGALDPGIRQDMHELVEALHAELGLTVFMVTHDLSEGFKLGSRLLVFDRERNARHDAGAYGARVTFDLALKHDTALPPTLPPTATAA